MSFNWIFDFIRITEHSHPLKNFPMFCRLTRVLVPNLNFRVIPRKIFFDHFFPLSPTQRPYSSRLFFFLSFHSSLPGVNSIQDKSPATWPLAKTVPPDCFLTLGPPTGRFLYGLSPVSLRRGRSSSGRLGDAGPFKAAHIQSKAPWRNVYQNIK